MERCNACGGPGRPKLLRCSSCKTVHYCSAEHQKEDWPSHRNACRHLQALAKEGLEWESNIPADEYAGTFRWYDKTDFEALPPLLHPWVQLPQLLGWSEFFEVRLDGRDSDQRQEDEAAELAGLPPPHGEPKVVLQPATMDALSFPLSLVWAVKQAVLVDKDVKDALIGGAQRLDIVALGCSSRAEEHVLHHTNYWEEVSHYFFKREVHLWLVGPEMTAAKHMVERRLTDGMVATCFRGTAGAFLKEQLSGHVPPRKTIFVCFNTGMASGDAPLRRSWAADLRCLLDRNQLIIFTAANDHTDIAGERQVMEREVHAKYVLFPRRNPFAAVTVLHPPGGRDTAWYSANAFVYAVKGYMDNSVAGAAAAAAHAASRSPPSAHTAPTTATASSQANSAGRAAAAAPVRGSKLSEAGPAVSTSAAATPPAAGAARPSTAAAEGALAATAVPDASSSVSRQAPGTSTSEGAAATPAQPQGAPAHAAAGAKAGAGRDGDDRGAQGSAGRTEASHPLLGHVGCSDDRDDLNEPG